MSTKPIFVATHPRACSTAFERVFMNRTDSLRCIHEPFGDAFYFGPERLSARYEDDEKARKESGFETSTFKTVMDHVLEGEKEGGRRIFIKDITHYLVPPEGKPASIAPSLGGQPVEQPTGNTTNGATKGSKAPYPYNTLSEPGNPTVVPAEILKKFHFTFLIRHPSRSIPSYYRCTVPPLDAITGFYNFLPSEAGYDELRRLFDYLVQTNQISSESGDAPEITVVDADDLLDNPSGIIQAYCERVGIDYDPNMLIWDTEEAHERARNAFEKWKGFHEDAINSTSLKPRSPEHQSKKTVKTVESENAEWTEKYGAEAQKVIRATVDANLADYEYLKKFALKV